MPIRKRLMLSGGREVEIGPCPCDERGDKLRELSDAMEGGAQPDSVKCPGCGQVVSPPHRELTMSEIQKALTGIALEAIGLFSPGIARADALHALDMADCYEIRRILWTERYP